MGFFDNFNDQLLPKLLGHHLRPHMACPKCKARMMTYLTYYLCPNCSKQVNKPTTKLYIPQPEKEPTSLEEILISDPGNQRQPSLGHFGAPSPLLNERGWLVSAGWILMLFAAMHWSYSIDTIYANQFTELFAWCLPCLGLIHIYVGYAMLCGSLIPRYLAAGLLLLVGFPMVLYMLFNVPQLVCVTGQHAYRWNTTFAQLSFALLAIHVAWDAYYLYREAIFMRENPWGEDY